MRHEIFETQTIGARLPKRYVTWLRAKADASKTTVTSVLITLLSKVIEKPKNNRSK